MHGSEGTVRILFCIALFAAGVGTPWLYGLALALPPLGRGRRSRCAASTDLLTPGPKAPYSELSGALAWLLLGSRARAAACRTQRSSPRRSSPTPSQKHLVGKFITGLFVARIPILLFQAVQAALLPKLARLAGEGAHDDFRTGMRQLVLIVSASACSAASRRDLIGPFVGEKLCSARTSGRSATATSVPAARSAAALSSWRLRSRRASSRCEATRHAPFAWVVGIVAFVIAVASIGHDLFLRGELGFLAGGRCAGWAR